MTDDKGLIKGTVEGVSACYPTEVTFMVLGTAAHAVYQSNKGRGYIEADDFGIFNPETLKFDLDVHIDVRGYVNDRGNYQDYGRDTEIYRVFNNYAKLDDIDYTYHAKSETWQIRALVAMNGECLELLSKDPHASVRQKVVESVLYQHENSNGYCGIVDFSCKTDEQEFLMFKRFVPISLNLGDISYIDDMIHDECEGVRYSIARMGITRHIDALINDPSPYVRMAVAYKGQEHHLEHLLNDDSPDVLRLIVSNQNATQQQLQTLAHRVKHIGVLTALIERGVYHEFFIDEEVDDWVKITAARNGYSHERLSKDAFSPIRQTVAEYTMDMNIINRLLEDEDSDVADVARFRKPNLNIRSGL